MSILLDDKKLDAIRNAVDAAGSQSAFARLTGLTKQHVSKYLRRDVKRIEYDTWYKMRPYLVKYLGPGESNVLSDTACAWDEPETTTRLAAVQPPAITTSDAVKFDSLIEPFDQFAYHSEHSYAPLSVQGEGFVVLVAGIADAPYPSGTLIYVNCREYPRHGSRVAALHTKKKKVVFMDFERESGSFRLVPVDGGRAISWTGPEDNPFSWIYPVFFAVSPSGRMK